MLAAMAFAAALTQDAVRLNSADIYCAAIGVLATETVQARPNPDPADEAAMVAMTIYFLGRVEGSMPQGGGAAEAIIEMAGVITPASIPPADIHDCAEFMRDQGNELIDQARRHGRTFR
jgi:hypothetical protein